MLNFILPDIHGLNHLAWTGGILITGSVLPDNTSTCCYSSLNSFLKKYIMLRAGV